MGAQDRLGLGRPGRFERGALLGHPAVELTPADRPTAELGGGVDRLLIAHLGDEPQPALVDPEGVRRPRLKAEGGIEWHDLRPTARAAIPASAQLDLAGEGHQATPRPTVRLHGPAAGGAAGRHRQGLLQAIDHFAPESDADLDEGLADRPLQRADVRVVGRQANLDRHRTLHLEPLLVCWLADTNSVRTGLSPLPRQPAQRMGCLPLRRGSLPEPRGFVRLPEFGDGVSPRTG